VESRAPGDGTRPVPGCAAPGLLALLGTCPEICDRAVMGIDVKVVEFDGQVVARRDDPVDVNLLCAIAGEAPGRYPHLSGVDEYDDTYFNARQSKRLAQELEAIAQDSGDEVLRQAAEAVLRLVRMLEPAPGRPHHRQLVFVGD
jgi:hypothetical protein